MFFIWLLYSTFCVLPLAEIERFHGTVIVKFASEEQAAEAAKCENGLHSAGSNIKAQLADSDTVQRLVQGYSRSKIFCRSRDGYCSGSSPMPPPRKK